MKNTTVKTDGTTYAIGTTLDSFIITKPGSAPKCRWLPTPRANGNIAVDYIGRILVYGGTTDGHPNRVIDVYDPQLGAWSESPALMPLKETLV